MFHELIMAAAAGVLISGSNGQSAVSSHSVLELRQYKIVHGKRDEFISLFDERFVESQEALGMRLVGQFRDLDDEDRFTWIRSFRDMQARGEELNAFYFGPVWMANRQRANPMLVDNDNVLLLRPATPELAFASENGRPGIDAVVGQPKTILGAIEYLWKTPEEGFTAFFTSDLMPILQHAGLTIVGGYVPEEADNNFPRLPVRPDRKIFVWFATAPNETALDRSLSELQQNPRWAKTMRQLMEFEERKPQFLRLQPTARSALR